MVPTFYKQTLLARNVGDTDKILGESGIDKNQYIMRKKYNLLKLLN